MTITTQTFRAQYSGNGATTEFSVPFEFLATTGVRVILTDANGVDTTWVHGTQYNVRNSDGTPIVNRTQATIGKVVVVTAPSNYTPATGTRLTILRNEPLTQAASYTEQGPFPAKAHERALDRLEMQIHTLADKLGRVPVLKETSAISGLILPEPSADKIIGWNSGGTELENKALTDLQSGLYGVLDEDDMASDSATNVPTQQSVKAYADLKLAKASNLSDVPNAVTALGNLDYQRTAGDSTFAVLSSVNKMSQRADLRDWDGLDLTGTNDNASLMQSAVNTMATEGARLHVPGGDIVLDSTIIVPAHAKIHGAGRGYSSRGEGLTDTAEATYFHLSHSDVGFQLIGEKGLRELIGISTYRDQPAEAGGWAPTAHDYDINIHGVHGAVVRDIFMFNPTRGLLVDADPAFTTTDGAGNGRLVIENIFGNPFEIGMDLSSIYDTIYMDKVHFWPYASAPTDTNIRNWTKANGESFRFGRVDNSDIGRLFSWGSNIGVRFYRQSDIGVVSAPAGAASLVHFQSLGLDNTNRAVLIDSSVTAITLMIDSMYGHGGPVAATNRHFDVQGSGAEVWIGNMSLPKADAGGVLIQGSSNSVRISKYSSASAGAADFNVTGSVSNYLEIATKPVTSAVTPYSGFDISSPDWRSFAPTVTASSGTITTVGTLSCKFKRQGNTVHFDYSIPITTNGTGAGVLQATLPIAALRTSTVGVGSRSGTGAMCKGITAASGTTLSITTYDNLYPAADGITVRVSGSYEIA